MGLNRNTPLRADPEKVREWKDRSRRNNPLKRTGGLSRGGRIGRNTERMKKRRERDFGKKAKWLSKNIPCLICGKLPTEPHHHPTRAAGGTKKDLTALCAFHHRQFHTLGAESWQELHGVDLRAEAERLEERWQARGEG